MADFHFIRPWWLLAVVPAFVCWWGLWRQQKHTDNLQWFIDPHLLEHLLVGGRQKHLVRPIHVLLGVWILAVTAAAGPAWQREASPFLSDEAGLMILLKTSDTMEAGDVQPSRLARAKQKISDIMASRKGGSTGLIVYSGSAHLVMPLTGDDRIINTMLEDMGPDLMPVNGDRLSDALELGAGMVEQSGLPGSLLVVADSAAEPAFERAAVPVQLLSVQPFGVAPDPGLQRASSALQAPLTSLTPDQADVSQIVRRAETSRLSVNEPGRAERWKDGGYLLLPLIAAGMLLWFRKGWVIR